MRFYFRDSPKAVARRQEAIARERRKLRSKDAGRLSKEAEAQLTDQTFLGDWNEDPQRIRGGDYATKWVAGNLYSAVKSIAEDSRVPFGILAFGNSQLYPGKQSGTMRTMVEGQPMTGVARWGLDGRGGHRGVIDITATRIGSRVRITMKGYMKQPPKIFDSQIDLMVPDAVMEGLQPL